MKKHVGFRRYARQAAPYITGLAACSLVLLLVWVVNFLHVPKQLVFANQWVSSVGSGLIVPACGSSSVGTSCSGFTPVATFNWTDGSGLSCDNGTAYVSVNGSVVGSGSCSGSFTWTGGAVNSGYSYQIYANYSSAQHTIDSGTFYEPAYCCVGNYGSSCQSGANACGQVNYGSIACDGSCTAGGPPANPPGYGSSCQSSANVCGQVNTGTINCSDVCSASSPPPASSSVSLSPSSVTIDQGQSVTLTWAPNSGCGLTSCTFFDGPSYGGSGSRSVSPSSSTTYGLSCTGPAGPSNSAYSNITVEVPTVSISASPSVVEAGGSVTVTWNATNVNSCSITKNGAAWQSQTANGSRTVSGSSNDTISSQTTYVITCTNNGSASAATATQVVNVAPGFQEF